jgi:hypothetical protein
MKTSNLATVRIFHIPFCFQVATHVENAANISGMACSKYDIKSVI